MISRLDCYKSCWEKNSRQGILIFVAFVLLFTSFSVTVAASSNHYSEINIQFQSTDQTLLNGSLLIPEVPGPHPVVILIHGAGWHDREDYRSEAEIFVKSGIAAFIYDKRTVGYSADGIGEQSRSYALLADDVLAAVDILRSREELDPKLIGLWGLSEGSSVAPLAAVQSNDVAFVITVSASGVPPAQQTSWELENKYREQGITASSFIHSMTRTGIRFLVSSDLFAEATYDHVPPLEKMQQPLLAIWGNNDRTTPPVENYQIMRSALEHGGNVYVTFQFIPEANHDLRLSTNGFINSEQFAPGYVEAMVSWIQDIVDGNGAGINVIGNMPEQSYTSFDGITESFWYDSAWSHLAMMIILSTTFFSFFGMALIRFRRVKVISTRSRLRWYAGAIAVTGTASVLGFFGYFGYIMMTSEPGLIILGSPLSWLVLQLLSIVTIVLTVMLAVMLVVSRRKAQSSTDRFERIRLGSQLIGGILFIPWALYWKILLPLV